MHTKETQYMGLTEVNKNRIKTAIIPAILISLFMVLGFSAKHYKGIAHVGLLIGLFIALSAVCLCVISCTYIYLDRC